MQAVMQRRYGSPDRALRLEDVPLPAVADDAVLVRVRATSINAGDWRRMRAEPIVVRAIEGWRAPRDGAIGADVAGVVEAVGSAVTHLRVGDPVFGLRTGAFAEYVSGRNFVPMPAGLTFEQAAAIPVTGSTALQALRDKGKIAAGQRVLVTGASGGVGTMAVQMARAFGAKVTGVCRTDHVETVRSLGADRVIDYTRDDFAKDGERYDLIVDIAGFRSLRATRRALAPNGTLLVLGGRRGWIAPADRLAGAALLAKLGKRVIPYISHVSFEDLQTLKELAESGKIRPVIDRTYPLRDIAEAMAYAEQMHVCGKVVITV